MTLPRNQSLGTREGVILKFSNSCYLHYVDLVQLIMDGKIRSKTYTYHYTLFWYLFPRKQKKQSIITICLEQYEVQVFNRVITSQRCRRRSGPSHICYVLLAGSRIPPPGQRCSTESPMTNTRPGSGKSTSLCSRITQTISIAVTGGLSAGVAF